MLNDQLVRLAVAIVFALSICVAGTVAQSRHTYVDPTIQTSGNMPGQQSPNQCDSPQRPCKTIAEALAKTQSGGKITLLQASPSDDDASNNCTISYSTSVPLSIEKSITIEPARGLARKPCFLVDNEVTGIVVGPRNTHSESIVVTLRGLRFVHGNVGSIGIAFETGSRLRVENCAFSLFHAISSGSSGELDVIGSTFRAAKGVMLEKTNTKSKALIDRCKFIGHNNVAILARENRSVMLTRSEITKADSAFWLYDNANLSVENTTVETTDQPVQMFGKATLTLKNVVITHGP